MFNITENCSKKTVILMQNLVQNFLFLYEPTKRSQNALILCVSC